MAKTFIGRCHCGATEWSVKLEEDQQKHVLCHCWACKLQTGAEATLNTLVQRDAFSITKGELKQVTYTGDSGSPVHCYFCATCATHPYHHQTTRGPDTLVVRTILLAGAKDWPVAAEVYGKDRLAWVPEVATTFEVSPPS